MDNQFIGAVVFLFSYTPLFLLVYFRGNLSGKRLKVFVIYSSFVCIAMIYATARYVPF